MCTVNIMGVFFLDKKKIKKKKKKSGGGGGAKTFFCPPPPHIDFSPPPPPSLISECIPGKNNVGHMKLRFKQLQIISTFGLREVNMNIF